MENKSINLTVNILCIFKIGYLFIDINYIKDEEFKCFK